MDRIARRWSSSSARGIFRMILLSWRLIAWGRGDVPVRDALGLIARRRRVIGGGGSDVGVDATDLVDLVRLAHEACGNWFSLIAPQDVEDAMEEVRLNK